MKIRPKNRKWILHYYRMGADHEQFGCNYMEGISESWPIDPNGVSAVQAFAEYESSGKRLPTRHAKAIQRLTAGKKIHGLNVQMWAQDRAEALLSKRELKEYCNDVPGLLEEVERQKVEYWPETFTHQ